MRDYAHRPASSSGGTANPPPSGPGGSILILTDATAQRDQWIYRTVLRDAAGSFAFHPLCRPVFASRPAGPRLERLTSCISDGAPLTFRYSLKSPLSIAFQTRFLQPRRRENLATTMPINSPLRAMADQLYAMKDDRLVGQLDDATESRWPGVVIERAAASLPVARAARP